MDILVVIGRILFSAIFIRSGVQHFTRVAMMSPYAGAKGVPATKFMVRLTGRDECLLEGSAYSWCVRPYRRSFAGNLPDSHGDHYAQLLDAD